MKIGDPVPDLALTDLAGHAVDWRKTADESPLFLVFFRGAW